MSVANGTKKLPKDAVDRAVNRLHVESRAEKVARALRSIEDEREELWVQQTFMRVDDDQKIPNYPPRIRTNKKGEDESTPVTFGLRVKELDDGEAAFQEECEADVWNRANQLYNDPTWKPEKKCPNCGTELPPS